MAARALRRRYGRSTGPGEPGDLVKTKYSIRGRRVGVLVGATGLGDKIYELVHLWDRGESSLTPRRIHPTFHGAMDDLKRHAD